MRILVAIDGSADAAAGLEWVAGLPLSEADEVLLLTVLKPEDTPGRARRVHERHLELLLRDVWATRRDEARRLLADAGAAGSMWSARTRQVIREGHPVAEIDAAARELGADLVVAGPRGRGAVPGLLLGSVTRSLLGVLDRPLVVARRPVMLPDPILVAIDGSPAADAALARIASYAWTARAVITVLVVAAGRPGRSLAGALGRSVADQDRQDAGRIAAEAAERLAATGRSATPLVVEGDGARRIVETGARLGAGLLVLGTRGGGGFPGMLVGSVAQRVVATARRTVMVVPPVAPSQGGGAPGLVT
jgi:nucleotide-binding universal stress UspA family protein